MGLFGSSQTVFLKYQINLTDPVLVDTLRGGAKGTPLEHISPLPPNFPVGTPANVPGTPNPAGKGADALYGLAIETQNQGLFTYPCITSEWFTTDGSNNFPRNQQGFTRKSGGWFGIPALFGDTTTYYWRGEFNWVPADTGPGGLILPAMPLRHFIDGFELPDKGDGGSGNAGPLAARGASRSVQGYGLQLDSAPFQKTHNRTTFGAPATKPFWDRFYLRIRRYPSAVASQLWICQGVPSPQSGCRIDILPSGQLAINAVDNVGTITLLGTTANPIPLNKYQKIDLLGSYAQSPLQGSMQIYVNGTSVLFVNFPLSTGGMQGTSITNSSLGNPNANDASINLDDWIGSNQPDLSLTSSDWVNGSRILLVRPVARAASDDGHWAGDVRYLLQRPVDQASPTALTSSTALGRLAVTTDCKRSTDIEIGSLGYAAIGVGLYSVRGTNDGQLGYKLPGGADVLTNVTEGNGGAFAWSSVLTSSLATAPVTPLAGLELMHIKGNAADACSTASLMAQVELIGNFGDEDLPPAQTATGPRTLVGIHDAPYPNTPWAKQGPPPISPVAIESGTYTGNGTAQDLTFKFPIAFMFIRPTAPSGGCFWWSSLNAAHVAGARRYQAEAVPDALQDPNFVGSGVIDTQEVQFLVRIAGNNSEVNTLGVTYHYIAFSDPGMRFCEAGALFESALAGPVDTLLPDTNFTPEVGLFHHETAGTSSTFGAFFRGIGHAPGNVSPLNSGELTTAITFAKGKITSDANMHIAGGTLAQIGYIVFRRDDGSKDTGIPQVLQLASYVGDGTGSRTIGLAPLSGLRPVFAFVVPHNVATFYRDAMHTGTTSTQYPNTANAATGITAGGVDSISVGSALNSNGVSYDVFVFPGSSIAGNNGWSIDGEFVPVAPGNPPSPPYDPTPTDPLGPAAPPAGGGGGGGTGPGTGGPGGGQDFGTVCLPFTTAVANIALSRIGVSKVIVNPLTDQSNEATQILLHYGRAVCDTLVAFPWPFATAYATLVPIVGAPVTADWTITYRQPADCLFERRLVVARGPAMDPTPPAFALSSDTTGGLILTNQANAILEYTARPACSGASPDSLFQDALAWRLASMLSPSISRIADSAVLCMKMFEEVIVKAKLIVRPDYPGTIPAAPGIDTAAAAIAANLQVANRALMAIGAPMVATLILDNSDEANAVRAVFEDELQATLRDHPWAFATAYVKLAIGAGVVGGTPVNPDWQLAYAPLPTNLVFGRRLVTPQVVFGDPFLLMYPPPMMSGMGGRRFNPNPAMFRMGQLDLGLAGGGAATGIVPVLYTDYYDTDPTTGVRTTTLEYTARYDGLMTMADSLFRTAFTWRLAAAIAPTVARRVPENSDQRGRGPEPALEPKTSDTASYQLREKARAFAWQMYQHTLNIAKAQDANEQQADTNTGDSPWILGRN